MAAKRTKKDTTTTSTQETTLTPKAKDKEKAKATPTPPSNADQLFPSSSSSPETQQHIVCQPTLQETITREQYKVLLQMVTATMKENNTINERISDMETVQNHLTNRLEEALQNHPDSASLSTLATANHDIISQQIHTLDTDSQHYITNNKTSKRP